MALGDELPKHSDSAVFFMLMKPLYLSFMSDCEVMEEAHQVVG